MARERGEEWIERYGGKISSEWFFPKALQILDEAPTVYAAAALHILRAMPELNAVVHTHSGYATAFAALGEPVPVCPTEHGDAFGVEVPCATTRRSAGRRSARKSCASFASAGRSARPS